MDQFGQTSRDDTTPTQGAFHFCIPVSLGFTLGGCIKYFLQKVRVPGAG